MSTPVADPLHAGGAGAVPAVSVAKARILDATYELMLKGAPHPSMAEIAQAAGISRQALYAHYGTREALLTALNQHLGERFGIAEELRRITGAASGLDALRASAAFQARLYPKVWAVVRALELSQISNDEDARRVLQTQLRHDLAGCKRTVERLSREKLLRPGLSIETATDLLWALTSISFWEELVQQRGWSAKRYREHVSDLLIAALVGNTAGA